MLLRIENVSAAYGATEALRGVSVEVDAGEVVTLIGANGAGKSTTLLAISGLVEKTAGRVIFDGVDISRIAPHDIVRMGVVHVPEGRRIFPRLTVEENLRMGAFTRRAIDPELLDRAFMLFPILKERRSQAGGTLSGGEQQMLAIARGLMARPKLLLLDEPSLGIAPKLIERIFEALAEIHRGGTPILLVEQNAQLALEFAQRAYVLETGSITLSGAGSELLHNKAVMKAYLGL
jgi:branched-chain amino acid transport system ATP-binding protein